MCSSSNAQGTDRNQILVIVYIISIGSLTKDSTALMCWVFGVMSSPGWMNILAMYESAIA